jgi:CheY-like chemotaxis protein
LPDQLTTEQCALIVDDNADHAELLAMLIGRGGYQTETATSGQEALERCRAQDFQLIVCDIGMPGMNGYELARALRATPGFEKTPMIAVTGFSVFDDRGRAKHAGFDELVTKPIAPQGLIVMIDRLRKNKR